MVAMVAFTVEPAFAAQGCRAFGEETYLKELELQTPMTMIM
jgi:hypothetical protein